MAETSVQILERFRRDHARDNASDINLTLRPAYREALRRLGNPEQKLQQVFHVADTNGKGSTCAFLRAICEAAGHSVHVYTSPHLISFHERIRVAGKLIGEDELVGILQQIEQVSTAGALSYFEAATIAAFVAFARHPADITILEVGLGGRLDATNILEHPLATMISRISFDHREYLGDTLTKIAGEKAGIMRRDVPCFVTAQPDAEVAKTLATMATEKGAPLFQNGMDWYIEPRTDGFHFHDATRDLDLPAPALLGHHQYGNAGLAIAALSVLPQPPDLLAITQGLLNVEWPARLQHLNQGYLVSLLRPGWELWLDGGHNDSAGDVLGAQAGIWKSADGKPLYLLCGMLTTKIPQEFLQSLFPFTERLMTVTIPNEPQSFLAEDFARLMQEEQYVNTQAADSVETAILDIVENEIPGRILICGSLYLAGDILRINNA